MDRVLPGAEEARASFLLLQIVLIKLLFPALERPTTATSYSGCGSYCPGRYAVETSLVLVSSIRLLQKRDIQYVVDGFHRNAVHLAEQLLRNFL